MPRRIVEGKNDSAPAKFISEGDALQFISKIDLRGGPLKKRFYECKNDKCINN